MPQKPKTPVPSPARHATQPAARRPVAPPVYRPQPVPKVLQTKAAVAQPKAGTRQTPGQNQPQRHVTAPPVYRPQPAPRCLQMKASAGARSATDNKASNKSSATPTALAHGRVNNRPSPPAGSAGQTVQPFLGLGTLWGWLTSSCRKNAPPPPPPPPPILPPPILPPPPPPQQQQLNLPPPPPPPTNQDVQTKLTDLRGRFTQIKNRLPGQFWELQNNTPTLENEADLVGTYLARGLQSIPDATTAMARLATLETDIASTLSIATKYESRLRLVTELYREYANALPNTVTSLLADIWTPLLNQAHAPNEITLRINLENAERAFSNHLTIPDDDSMSNANKKKHFVHLYKLGKVKPNPDNGVKDVYKSPFDAPKDCFGVEWLLTGLDGWVLHGHGRLTWDAEEKEIVTFALPSLHIKPANKIKQLGVSVEIDDATVIADLTRRSLKHVKALGTSNKHTVIFARTKFKKK